MTAPHTTASPAEAAPQGTHTFLSSRLVVTGILAAGLALLTVVVALTGVDYWSSRASMLQDSRVEAAIVADNISAAVMFRDNTAANEMLGALRSSSMVISATVYDEDGVLFAHYARMPDPGLPTTLQAVGLNGATERADWRMLEIARPIEVSAKGWGTLYIRKSMEALYTAGPAVWQCLGDRSLRHGPGHRHGAAQPRRRAGGRRPPAHPCPHRCRHRHG